MDEATLAAAVRRFPLLGRRRPACPALPIRIQEITDAIATAKHKAEHGMADAAHALNKAALVASDGGMPHLAGQLCWQHIDAYRRVERPLTFLEARYLLEPVVNLARLQIRADQGTSALQLLEAMYQAVTRRSDLTVGDHTIATASLVGDQQDRRRLRGWVWLQVIGEGVRALALADRWTDAAEHARAHHGIGVHLMEGRQAAIIARCIHGDLADSRALLAQSTPTQPWEQEVGACLNIMCMEPTDALVAHHLATAIRRLNARTPVPGYAPYRARLGLTIATLASRVCPEWAMSVLGQVAEEVIESADGYAARDVLGFPMPIDGISEHQRTDLGRVAADSGLGIGAIPDPIAELLAATADEAVEAIDRALSTAT